ncbi:MAG: HesA/MoeB/ThiF family protein [Eubacteriales bacterium]|nr:HesA/MoeB/ThiF family protein [Eubacteriales bacterium]
MEKRYERNHSTISEEDMVVLKNSKVLVVGCGGLGGYIIEMLIRIGLGYLTVVDGDVFEESNLNRQLYSTMKNLGMSKAEAVKARVHLVNPDTELIAVSHKLTPENIHSIIRDHDLVIDAVDNIETRLLLEATCCEHDLPLIHGAIAGWYFQLSVIIPGDNLLSKIYGSSSEKGIESVLGNPSFTPAAAASFQVAECIKVLLNKDLPLKGKLLYVDLLNNSFDILEI